MEEAYLTRRLYKAGRTKKDCYKTMRNANLRIHVKRAIRRIKGFDNTFP